MSRRKPPSDMVVRNGAKARSFIDENEVRMFVPWRVTYEVQLSPLAITTDTLEFYLYAENSEVALKIAGRMIVLWQVSERRPPNGYPKPINGGQASAQQIADKEYTQTLRQAQSAGLDIRYAMDKKDPTGFHIKNKTTTIYVPGTK